MAIGLVAVRSGATDRRIHEGSGMMPKGQKNARINANDVSVSWTCHHNGKFNFFWLWKILIVYQGSSDQQGESQISDVRVELNATAILRFFVER